jgi:hypothetical protein
MEHHFSVSTTTNKTIEQLISQKGQSILCIRKQRFWRKDILINIEAASYFQNVTSVFLFQILDFWKM